MIASTKDLYLICLNSPAALITKMLDSRIPFKKKLTSIKYKTPAGKTRCAPKHRAIKDVYKRQRFGVAQGKLPIFLLAFKQRLKIMAAACNRGTLLDTGQ